MHYFPLFIKLNKRHCLVVGAGEVATRKIALLAKTGAIITVIAEHISPAVNAMKTQHSLIIKEKSFAKTDAMGFQLIVSATNDSATNILVADAATQFNIAVNVVDNPDLCSFIFPSIIHRSPIMIAISSGGASPVLARLLRAKIESLIPPAFGQLANLAQKFRDRVKQHILAPTQRRIFWEQVLQGTIAELVLGGKPQEAEKQLTLLLTQTENITHKGEVYLVGAGPGNPDLLTLRALRLIQQADVVIYDRLVSAEILDLTRTDSQKIYAGKQRQNHNLSQHSINQLLASLAKQGKRVVRLKGGDPFIFGRGGEEIETLVAEGVDFQIVPGITAASGCATYAGIPLTHRDHAQSCIFVAGHQKDNVINLNWTQLTAPNQTLVFYMGLAGVHKICHSLIQHGCAKNHPIAIIQQGTTAQQRVITGTLATFPQQVANAGIKAPTLIIVGTVVSLHDKLHWFKP